MRDGGLVTRRILEGILGGPEACGGTDPVVRIAQREPVLAAYVNQWRFVAAGKLALSGASSEIVTQFVTDAVEAIVTSIIALWTGHDSIWKDVEIDSIHHQSHAQPDLARGCRGRGRGIRSSPRKGRFAGSAE